MIKQYISLMRIKHYIKNILIFVPLFFSGSFFSGSYFKKALIGFVIFSLVSSIVYIINDICDVEKDRMHPKKCKRPIASGVISKHKAMVFALVLGLGVIFLCFFLKMELGGYLVVLLYFGTNICYSVGGIKNYPILDVVCLAFGFLLRVVYGAYILEIEISEWLLLTVLTFSFYLGLGKRRNELMQQKEGDTRKVLLYYNYEFLDKNMYVFLTLGNIFYALWSMGNNKERMIWTTPLVWLICLKYSYNIEKCSDGDPVEVIIRDKVLIGMCMMLGTAMLAIIYI